MAKVLVLGANGFIGSACVRTLACRGFDVVGMARSRNPHPHFMQTNTWVTADITRLSTKEWSHYLNGIDVVVNAAGALQDGSRDNLKTIHVDAIESLLAAAPPSLTFVQISAAGVALDATTDFFRTKARGDAAVAKALVNWTILRPTLVIGPNAYGGTALLRSIAAMPVVQPRVFENSHVQTIALDELAEAVADCADGKIQSKQVYDLTEDESRSFPTLIADVRAWLGWSPARWQVFVPMPLINLAGRVADALGWLGWRSPMRTTSVRTLQAGIAGDSTLWRDAGGRSFSNLSEILTRLPSTVQERIFSRMFLLLPLVVAVLSAFWIASGLIGLWQGKAASTVLTSRGISTGLASLTVTVGSVADLALGLLILYRPWARFACLGMIALSLAYLFGATVFATDLWADPLGPLVKVVPSIVLAILAHVMLEER